MDLGRRGSRHSPMAKDKGWRREQETGVIKMGFSKPEPGPPREHPEGAMRAAGGDLWFYEDAARGIGLSMGRRAEPADLPHAPGIPAPH